MQKIKLTVRQKKKTRKEAKRNKKNVIRRAIDNVWQSDDGVFNVSSGFYCFCRAIDLFSLGNIHSNDFTKPLSYIKGKC